MQNVETAIMNMRKFQSLMSDDFEKAKEFARADLSQFSMRTLFRTSVTYLEGVTYQLRLVCLAASEDIPGVFTSKQILELKQVKPDKNGDTTEKVHFQKLRPSIVLTFSMFAKMHTIEFKPDTDDHRYGSLKEFMDVRHSLMHPKSLDDLEINSKKNKAGIEAVSWFNENLKALFRACELAEKEVRV